MSCRLGSAEPTGAWISSTLIRLSGTGLSASSDTLASESFSSSSAGSSSATESAPGLVMMVDRPMILLAISAPDCEPLLRRRTRSTFG